MNKPTLTQAEANLGNPEEHFAWALRNLPMVAGSGMMTFSGYLPGWSKHLWECGFSHRDYLAGLADEDGNIHVSKLPQQKIRFQDPFRGPHHNWNNASRWAKANEPEPDPVRIPDIRKLTVQERNALYYQFEALGMIPDRSPKPSGAEVLTEGPTDE